jgi:hypothetical protein
MKNSALITFLLFIMLFAFSAHLSGQIDKPIVIPKKTTAVKPRQHEPASNTSTPSCQLQQKEKLTPADMSAAKAAGLYGKVKTVIGYTKDGMYKTSYDQAGEITEESYEREETEYGYRGYSKVYTYSKTGNTLLRYEKGNNAPHKITFGKNRRDGGSCSDCDDATRITFDKYGRVKEDLGYEWGSLFVYEGASPFAVKMEFGYEFEMVSEEYEYLKTDEYCNWTERKVTTEIFVEDETGWRKATPEEWAELFTYTKKEEIVTRTITYYHDEECEKLYKEYAAWFPNETAFCAECELKGLAAMTQKGEQKKSEYIAERDDVYSKYALYFPDKSAFERKYDRIGKEEMTRHANVTKQQYEAEREKLYSEYALYFPDKSAFERKYDRIGKEEMTRHANVTKQQYEAERDSLYTRFAKYYPDKTAFQQLYDHNGKERMPSIAQQTADRQDFEEFCKKVNEIKDTDFENAKKDKHGIKQEISNFENRVFYPDVIDFVIENNKKLSKKWEKEGSFFTDKREFYRAFTSKNYKDVLKEKKGKYQKDNSIQNSIIEKKVNFFVKVLLFFLRIFTYH